jgi:acyl-CoA reductase-like NAD-dependent aldehyde dehydrogenase
LNNRINEFIALESLDNGKPYFLARTDIEMVVDSLRFFSGCADKVTGKTFATNDA